MNKPAIAIAALLGLAAAQSAWANPPTQTLTEPKARSLVMGWGCTNVSRLSQGQSGRWFGRCQKGGETVNVMVDNQGKVSQGESSSFTSSRARAELMDHNCNNVSTLTLGPDQRWHGTCQKGGNTVQVMVDRQGRIAGL